MTDVIGTLHGRLVFGRRTRVLAEHLAQVLPEAGRVLDVGCGDGTIDRLVMDLRPGLQIEGIDILVRPVTHIPVTLFDGDHIPFPDNSFDAVVFVDVLHHTNDPAALLAEARRVARRCIVIKDHLAEGLLAWTTLRFMDWVGNAPHGVVLPYNYWRESQWQTAFSDTGLSVEEWRSRIGLYPWPASMVFDRRLHFVARLGT